MKGFSISWLCSVFRGRRESRFSPEPHICTAPARVLEFNRELCAISIDDALKIRELWNDWFNQAMRNSRHHGGDSCAP